MNATVLSRRAMLGATAAIGVVALPIAGQAMATSADLDAELFRLLEAYPATLATMKEAGDRCEALWDLFIDEEPERPKALHVRFGPDNLGCGWSVERVASGREVALYDAAAVEMLRGLPLPTCQRWLGKPAPWGRGEEVGNFVKVPDERAIARRAEVLAAHDAWWADCQAIKDRLGIPAADAADDRATEAVNDLDAAILATAPTTFAGLAAKARWAGQCRLGAVFAADWHRQVVKDVVAMAERGGVAS